MIGNTLFDLSGFESVKKSGRGGVSRIKESFIHYSTEFNSKSLILYLSESATNELYLLGWDRVDVLHSPDYKTFVICEGDSRKVSSNRKRGSISLTSLMEEYGRNHTHGNTVVTDSWEMTTGGHWVLILKEVQA